MSWNKEVQYILIQYRNKWTEQCSTVVLAIFLELEEFHDTFGEKVCNKVRFITKRGSSVDRRPSTDEARPIGKIHPFSKMAITFEPLMGFRCPSGFRKVLITMI